MTETKEKKKTVTHLVNLVKLANYIESYIRKFILEKRKEYWKQLFYGSILKKFHGITGRDQC